MFDNELSKTELHVIMTAVALAGVITFAFVRKPFVHRTARLRASFKLSHESAYFLDDSQTQSVHSKSFSRRGPSKPAAGLAKSLHSQ